MRVPLAFPLTLQAAPCASEIGDILSSVAAEYDLCGFPVTIQAAPGTYTKPVALSGQLVGQTSGAGQIKIIGDINTPSNCVIAPTNGDCVMAANNAAFTITGFRGDLENNSMPGEGILTAGGDAYIAVGFFEFGNVPATWVNDITVNYGGQVHVMPGKLAWKAAAGAQKQCMFDVGVGGKMIFDTNCGQAPLLLEADNVPSYNSGIFRADMGSIILGGAAYQGLVHGKQWWVDGYSVFVTYTPFGQMFGDVAGYTGPAGQVRQT